MIQIFEVYKLTILVLISVLIIILLIIFNIRFGIKIDELMLQLSSSGNLCKCGRDFIDNYLHADYLMLKDFLAGTCRRPSDR